MESPTPEQLDVAKEEKKAADRKYQERKRAKAKMAVEENKDLKLKLHDAEKIIREKDEMIDNMNRELSFYKNFYKDAIKNCSFNLP